MVRLGIALAIAFGGVALGAGYWQVLRADDLSHDPSDAGVIAAARSTVRGRILDRDGRVLATNRRDASGELYRVYSDRSLSAPLGNVSSLYGSAGLEAAAVPAAVNAFAPAVVVLYEASSWPQSYNTSLTDALRLKLLPVCLSRKL